MAKQHISKSVMAIIDGLLVRSLTPDDIPGALSLSEEAGWNQNVRDWQLMLAHGRGFGMESKEGQLVATALTLPHGNRLAWISMVLVTGSYRQQGLATHLLKTCIDALSSQKLYPLLDATEAGKIVYGKIGFRPLYGLQRMVREKEDFSHEKLSVQASVDIRSMEEADIPSILELDQTIFGADRSAVLRHLFKRQPGSSRMIGQGDRLKGYVMVREGYHAFHIGPIVAPDCKSAIAMTSQILDDIEGPVYIDTMDHHTAFQSWLKENGFKTQRSFTRMVLGDLDSFDQQDRIFAAVGPELG